MFKSIARILVTGLLLVPVSAMAVPITVDFTITSSGALGPNGNFDATEYNGFALGSTGTGWFTIDDSIGNYSSFDVGITPLDFSLNWAGVSFDESSAQLWQVGFDGAGSFSYWGFGLLGGYCVNLNCHSSIGISDFFASGVSDGSGVASIHATDVSGWMSGSLSWSVRPQTEVPEPATLGLFGLGLLGLAATRRKRAA